MGQLDGCSIASVRSMTIKYPSLEFSLGSRRDCWILVIWEGGNPLGRKEGLSVP